MKIILVSYKSTIVYYSLITEDYQGRRSHPFECLIQKYGFNLMTDRITKHRISSAPKCNCPLQNIIIIVIV